MSADLTKTVVRTNAKLTPDGWEGSPTGTHPPLPHYIRNNITGEYQLLTPEPVSGSVPYATGYVWGSETLNHILIETQAILTDDAVPVEGEPAASQWKVYRWSNGSIELVSVDPDGNAIAGAGGTPIAGANIAKLNDHAISTDGSVAWFSSPVTTSGAGAPLYRRAGFGEDAETVLVSESEIPGPPAPPGNAQFFGASADGKRVLFTTRESLVSDDIKPDPDDNPPCTRMDATDLYLYTHSENPETDDNLTRVSYDLPPRQRVLGVLGKSDDASRIYFVTEDDCNVQPSPERHIFLWDEHAEEPLQHLGTVPSQGVITGSGARGVPWQNGENLGRHRRGVSADGSALLVVSSAQLDADNPDGDTGGFEQVFRYGIGEGWSCISCPPDGSAPSGGSMLTFEAPYQTSIWGNLNRRVLSDDGERAFFTAGHRGSYAGGPLVSDDINGKADVYMWEDGEVSLISSGLSPDPSYLFDASSDGSSVFFITWEQLSGWDKDGLADVYGAREGGGIPEPIPADPRCAEDSCQGEPSSAPVFTGPTSNAFSRSRPRAVAPRNCAPTARQARRLSRQAQRLRRSVRTRRASLSRAQKRRVMRRSVRLARSAKQKRRQAQLCRRANRRA